MKTTIKLNETAENELKEFIKTVLHCDEIDKARGTYDILANLAENDAIEWYCRRKRIEYENSMKATNFSESKQTESLWLAIRSCIDLKAKTYSDIGGVLIGNHNGASLYNNGRGDGLTRVGLITDYNATKFMHLEGYCIIKDGGIFPYDCCNIETTQYEPIENGTYEIYSYNGIIGLLKL